jgi:secretion/DNA translocation related TadE-like protein
MDQRGSATVALAGAAVAIVMLGVVATGVGTRVVLENQIGFAVDQAALAAADVARGVVSGIPCDVAREVLLSHQATLVLCDEETDSVVVQGRLVRGVHSLLATARAGVVDSGEK